MVENDFPPSMWCEIALTVLYLKDFIPTAHHPDTTPYESWHQMKPNISHLQPIGCMAYAKIPVEKGGSKLDPRSIKGILIGYFGRDAYRIYDPDSRKIIRSQDVIFEEGTGHKMLPLPEQLSGGSDQDIAGKPLSIPPATDAQTNLAPDHDTVLATSEQPAVPIPPELIPPVP